MKTKRAKKQTNKQTKIIKVTPPSGYATNK
jgi:hypothetical protein